MTTDRPAGTFAVRVLGPDGRAVGLGALVGERQIVTCAHVVNAALGLDPRSQGRPAGEVAVDFPLAEHSDDGVGRAVVVVWLPPPREGAAGDDIAGLELVSSRTPAGVAAALLAVDMPRPGRAVRVFGYPGTPPRPDGGWVAMTVRGSVGGGRLQLDSGPDSALRVQPGFSGSPVIDDAIGRVVGLVAAAPGGRDAERDSYAIGADRLRLAWPEVLAGRWQRTAGPARRDPAELTILHVSDTQFGRHHLFGGNGLTDADRGEDTLFSRLHRDIAGLADEHGLRPDLLVVTGDLAEWGLRSEFTQVVEFLGALAEAAEIPRRHVAMVPGNHDVNRKACEAYFAEQEADEAAPVPPYWPKWRWFAAAFAEFYGDTGAVTFTPDEPWTLFEMPDLAVVVAGLNSTMAESHRDADHYGWVGEHQLRWFADRLADYRKRGWLRLAAVHHNVVRGAVLDDENLRDADDLDRVMGETRLVNLLLHGHTHDAKLHRLPSGLMVLSTGSAAVDAAARPAEVPNQYQLVAVRRDGFTRYARQYSVGQRRWIGDTRVSRTGSDWRDERSAELADVDAAFPPPDRTGGTKADTAEGGKSGDTPADRAPPGSREEFLDRVAEATQVRCPGATITRRPEAGYLRVTQPLPGGGTEQWPVGVIDGPATQSAIDAFAETVHALFVSRDPSVRSELVHGGPAAPGELVARARKHGVRLRSFGEYQGLLDLTRLAEAQRERLANDRIYPAQLYVPQRYRIVSSGDGIRTGLIEQAIQWLSADDARLVIVLGDFGRGKTSFLRQLTRTLPAELPDVLPILVELRSLEKAPALDELLAQHLVRHGVEDINPAKLRYMIESGRVALLFDGFDELEFRVGYDNAADYLQVLLESVTGGAKVILTSRTQHFRSAEQVRTALGERLETRTASRVVVLEDFSEQQILHFLSNLYGGDHARAGARFDLLGDIGNLLELAHNPRMLAFIAALDDERLRAVQGEAGHISAAGLYREIIEFWLAGETARKQHGLPPIDERERLSACTALALRLWASRDLTIALNDLSAEVSATLTGLSERGYSDDEAGHSIASGSLLVRTEDGAFTFVHQSLMEWLVAAAAADDLSASGSTQILATRRMSRLMVAFFTDLAGHRAARRWAARTLADQGASHTAKQNALAIRDRADTAEGRDPAEGLPGHQDLTGVDLRSQDLTGRNLRGANLVRADLRGTRLRGTDLSGADLRYADLTGARMVGGSLRGAVLTGSRWDRAALLGTEGADETATSAALDAAAIAGRDTADVMLQPPTFPRSVAYSPDGSLLAVASHHAVEVIDAADVRVLRILHGHTGSVQGAVFSPSGTLLATAAEDGTARIWDPATGTTRTTLHGHEGTVWDVAFSPDGTLLATASSDKTVRIWDGDSGTTRMTLRGHTGIVWSVAFSPDGDLLATASRDGTARIWDPATGTTRTILSGHQGPVRDVAFSADGTLLATAADDGTVRIWDPATGAARTTLQGHDSGVQSVAFSPDGALLATASRDGTARIWDPATGTTRTILSGHAGWARDAAFSPGGDLLATAAADGTARIWDLTTGTVRTTLPGHTGGVYSVAFSPGGDLLATGFLDGAVVWDLTTGISRATLHGHIGGVRAVTFSPGGDLLATASYDFTAQIWDLASGATSIILEHDTPVQDVAFSPDGALLATAAADGTARIWDRATGTTRVILEGHSSRLEGVAFSPDGALLATASYDGTARIWDVTGRRTGRSFRRAVSPMKTLQGHAGGVLGVAFSPDGALLATSSSDGTARIWLVATGTGGAVLRGHNAPVRGVAFSPDGALLATASDDGTTRIWSVATGGARAILRVLPEGGYVALLPEGYKLNADPGDDLWWAIKLCRFAPGELDPYVPGLRRLPADAPIRLGAPLRLRLDLCVTPRLAEIIMPSAAVNFPRLPMKLGLGASLSRV